MNRIVKSLIASFAPHAVISVMILHGAVTVTSAFAEDRQSDLPKFRMSADEQNSASSRLGVWFLGGFPPGYEVHLGNAHFHEKLSLFSAGIEYGRIITARHGPGILNGHGEAVLEVIPFWRAYSPQQKIVVYDTVNAYPTYGQITSYSAQGASITPLLFRWNFKGRTGSAMEPWIQLGSGLLWTTKEFPQPTGSNTSKINFTPQLAVGENIFTKEKQSVDVSIRIIHISSAGLGTSNPGIPASLQFGVGYSWRR